MGHKTRKEVIHSFQVNFFAMGILNTLPWDVSNTLTTPVYSTLVTIDFRFSFCSMNNPICFVVFRQRTYNFKTFRIHNGHSPEGKEATVKVNE